MAQKRYKIKIIALLMLVVFVTMFFVGCNLISTNNKRDMEQTVADVNLQNDEAALSDAFKTLQVNDFDSSKLNNLHLQNTTIIKRDLLSAYLSYGYQQVGSMGIEEVFNTIMTNLTNSRLNLQLAMLYYLYQENITINSVVFDVTGDTGYTNANQSGTTQFKMQTNAFTDTNFTIENFNNRTNIENNDTTRKNLEILVASYKFFLTEREQNYILNTVNTSINEAIDRYERLELNLVTETTDENRTTPTGANQTNLYNLDEKSIVGIYTGYENTAISGYTKLPGSTTVTRTRAFTQFLSSLVNNGLIERGENYTDITKLNYYLIECITQYESLLGTKFAATIATLPIDIDNGVEQEYNRLQGIQQSMPQSEFVSTMDSLTDTSAIVATPQGTYGYMYNLLIPFSASQEAQLKGYEDKTSVEYYRARNSLAKGIVATDQRTPWITGGTNYSFNAQDVKKDYVTKMAADTSKNYFTTSTAQNATNYLFFNENFGQYGRAEGLTRYAGLYAYNGIVIDNNDGTLIAQPNSVGIEKFITDEFEGYINYIVDSNSITKQTFNWAKDYNTQNDYSFAIVYENKIASIEDNSNKYYYPGVINGSTQFGKAYRALSAVNELVFAYSTDTGSLNKPYGYAMSTTGTTEYVPEFEYAGKQLLAKEEGSYLAVVTDYGVHIMYLARKYDNSTQAKEVETYDKTKIGEIGSFSHFFYNATVNTVIGTFTSNTRNQYMEQINTNKTIKLYKNRYKDLYGR